MSTSRAIAAADAFVPYLPDDQAHQQVAGAWGKCVVTFSLDQKYESLLGFE